MSLMSLGVFVVWLLQFEMRLMNLEMLLMSLGVGLEHNLGDEFGVGVDEFDEFGVWLLCVCVEVGDVFDEFGFVFDEFGCGFGTGAWR